jgi:hypothetical protein
LKNKIETMNATVKTEVCPRCGSTDQQRGNLFARGDWVGFRDEDAAPMFTSRDKVEVLICNACGHAELFLGERRKRAA